MERKWEDRSYQWWDRWSLDQEQLCESHGTTHDLSAVIHFQTHSRKTSGEAREMGLRGVHR